MWGNNNEQGTASPGHVRGEQNSTGSANPTPCTPQGELIHTPGLQLGVGIQHRIVLLYHTLLQSVQVRPLARNPRLLLRDLLLTTTLQGVKHDVMTGWGSHPTGRVEHQSHRLYLQAARMAACQGERKNRPKIRRATHQDGCLLAQLPLLCLYRLRLAL